MKPLRVEAREVVWTVLMDPPRPDSFVHRRINAYEAHRALIEDEQPLALADAWTHVFVDECQDFTESDFRLLACIPPDPQRLFVTGDESQSMHLGGLLPATRSEAPAVEEVRARRLLPTPAAGV